MTCPGLSLIRARKVEKTGSTKRRSLEISSKASSSVGSRAFSERVKGMKKEGMNRST